MLQQEITPFANAHIEKIEAIRHEITMLLGTTPADRETVQVSRESLVEWLDDLKTSTRGFERFRVCAEDEWEQKERYRTYAKENGYPYS